MKLKHYYHIYANGLWQGPFQEHLTALTETGLLEALDFIGVGIVGTDLNRKLVKKTIPSSFVVVAEEGAGFEQVTHTPLSRDLNEPAKIFYAHTKGSANHRHNQESWRREMTQGTVYHWKECVDLLDKYDAVGCRWRRHPWRHYSGTFWWTTSNYLKSLAPISYTYRDDAEAWIGFSKTGGTHADIEIFKGELKVTSHSFGRTFVAQRTSYGQSLFDVTKLELPMVGDEYIGLSPVDGSKVLSYLISHGASCSILGNTIIVNSINASLV